jgi:membrane protease YdiL (CAAX protease family)
MTKNQSWLAVMWLFVWGTAVISQRVREWWVVFFTGILLLGLTWMVGRLPVGTPLSLNPVSGKALGMAAASGAALFLLFYAYVLRSSLPITGHVRAPLIVWAVLIAPVTEEMVFRGVVYTGLLRCAAWLGGGRMLELVGVFFIGGIFGVLHHRSSIYLAMTIAAGILYGLMRWQYRSVQTSIACHISYNALALLLLAR